MDASNTPTIDGSVAQDAPVQVKRKGNPFKVGHPRFGGRKPGSPNKRTKAAQDLAKEMGVDPVQFMLSILASDTVQVAMVNEQGCVVLGADGQPIMLTKPIPLDLKADMAKAVAAYIHPKLQATQVTGKDDGPVAVAGFDMTVLMTNPQAVAAAQELALMMAKPDAPALPEPAQDTDTE